MPREKSVRGATGGWSPAAILRDLAVAWRLFRDPKVPGMLKLLLPTAAIAYWLMPIDLMTGMPFDDIAVFVLAIRLFVQMAPPDAVQRALFPVSRSRRHDDDNVIDADWRVVDQ